MKVSELIKKLTTLMEEVGNIPVYLLETVIRNDRVKYDIEHEIDYISSVSDEYIYIKNKDIVECSE